MENILVIQAYKKLVILISTLFMWFLDGDKNVL